jgi:hypothetical protein
MIGPEVRRAFERWWTREGHYWLPDGAYPLWLNGRWYMRERHPGARVWRAEDDGSFTLMERDPNSLAVS